MNKEKDLFKLSSIETAICETQGDLFEFVANLGTDMEWFIPTYMNSDFCNREMDATYSYFQMEHPLEILDFLSKEIGECKIKPNKYFRLDVAFWLGYTYRQLKIQTGVSSKEIFQTISLEKLCNAYAGLHTVDEEMATDILCENFNLHKIKRTYNN